MKASNNGLTKHWEVSKSHVAFYSGNKIEIAQDNTYFTTIFNDQLKFIDCDTGLECQKLETNENSTIDDNYTDIVTCFCLHPNNQEVVIATQKLLLKHWDMNEKKCKRIIKGHTMPIIAMAYDASGTLVATGSTDKIVRVWDIEKGFCTHSFRDHSDIIQIVQFHSNPHQSWLFSASDDSTIKLWDLIQNECIATFRDHLSSPKCLCLSSNGWILVSGGMDKVLNFYELQGLKHIKLFPVMEEVYGMIVLSEETSLRYLGLEAKTKATNKLVNVMIIAGERGILRVIRFEMIGKDITTFKCEIIQTIEVSNISITANTSNLENNQEIESLRKIVGLHYRPLVGEVIAVSGDHNLYLYSIITNNMKDSLATLQQKKQFVGFNDDILDILWMPALKDSNDDNILENDISNCKFGVITNSSQIKVFNSSFHCILMDGHEDIVLAIDVTPDGRYLVSSSKDKTVRVWDLTSYKQIASAKGHSDAIGAIAVSQKLSTYQSKQSCIFSGGMDKVLKRWIFTPWQWISDIEIRVLETSHSIRAHDKDVNTIAVSPNDSIVATGSQDKLIKLWNANSLESIAILKGHKRGIWKIAFSPIDKCLVSASGDRTMKLWSISDYTCLQTFEGNTASVLSIKFINKGTQLISGSADGLLRLWTIRSGECENTFDKHSDRIWAIATPPIAYQSHLDCELFVSGGSDSNIHIWKDITKQVENDRLLKLEEGLILEQELMNDIRNKKYLKAFKAALALENASKILMIFTNVLQEQGDDINLQYTTIYPLMKLKETNDTSIPIACRLDSFIYHLIDEDLKKIVKYACEWNTNSKSCFISQIILYSILRLIPIDRLMKIHDLMEMLDMWLLYSEKHYQRVDRLNQSSFMLEFMTSLMTLLPIENEDILKSQNKLNTISFQLNTEQDEEDFMPVIFHDVSKNLIDDNDNDNEDDNEVEQKRKNTKKSGMKKKRKI